MLVDQNVDCLWFASFLKCDSQIFDKTTMVGVALILEYKKPSFQVYPQACLVPLTNEDLAYTFPPVIRIIYFAKCAWIGRGYPH